MARYIKTGYKRTLKVCPICKMERLMRFNQKVCLGVCALENNRQLQKGFRERRKNKKKEIIIKPSATECRESTTLTEKLICIYTHIGGERNTVKQIAEDLSRPVEQVKSILSEAHKSGRYDKHIKQLKEHHEAYYEVQRGAI